jgi:hypothetical protein
MTKVRIILVAALLSGAVQLPNLRAQEKGPAALWREWTILSSDNATAARALAFAAKTQTVAAAEDEGKVRLWDPVTGREGKLLECKGFKSILALQFDADGQRLFIAGDTGMQIWDAAKASMIKKWDWKVKDVTVAAFSADVTRVACAGDDGGIAILDTADGALKHTLGNKTKNAWTALALRADGRLVAAGNAKGEILIWRENQEPLMLPTAEGSSVRSLALSADGNRLVSVCRNKNPMVWDAAAEKALKELTRGTSKATWSVVAINAAGNVVGAGTAGGIVTLWNGDTGAVINDLEGHAGLIFALAFSPDGRLLATGCNDSEVRVWWNTSYKLEIPQVKLEEKELEAYIKDLGNTDKVKLSRAMLALSAARPQTLEVLKKTLKQGKPPDVKRIRQLIDELGDVQFSVRNKADKELAKMGEAARAEIQYALTKKVDLETKRRLEKLLDRLVVEPEEKLLTAQAIVLLERLGGTEAKEILVGVLYGVSDDELISQARAAVERLDSAKK